MKYIFLRSSYEPAYFYLKNTYKIEILFYNIEVINSPNTIFLLITCYWLVIRLVSFYS